MSDTPFVTIPRENYDEYLRLAGGAGAEQPAPEPANAALAEIDAEIAAAQAEARQEANAGAPASLRAERLQRQRLALLQQAEAEQQAEEITGHPDVRAIDERTTELETKLRGLSGDDREGRRAVIAELAGLKSQRLRVATDLGAAGESDAEERHEAIRQHIAGSHEPVQREATRREKVMIAMAEKRQQLHPAEPSQ